MNKKALIESAKFIARVILLVGVPATLAAIIAANPKAGVAIGFVLLFIDKYIHKLPNEYKGLLPF